MKDRKIKWVKSYNEIPEEIRKYNDVKPGDDLIGLAGNDGIIYLVKGRATDSTAFHEKFHIIYNHPRKERDPRMYVFHEIQANVYGYKKTGKPKHMLEQLRAIFNDVCYNIYDIDERKALILINSALSRTKAPDSWRDDFVKLKGEVGELSM